MNRIPQETWMNNTTRELSPVVTKHGLNSLALLFGSSLLICLLAGAALAYPDDDRSPLAPLAKDEILAAVQILKQAARVSDDSRFSLITLHEPSKQEVLDPRPGSQPDRKAFVVVYERNSNQTFEAIVDLSKVRIDDWAGGYFGDPKESGFRFRRAISYYGGDPSANLFATGPVEGVVVYVNLNTKKVFKFSDTGVVPRPKSATAPSLREGEHSREALKRL